MPVTSELPFSWHSTPNIHLCTIRDFKKMCKSNNFQITEEVINKLIGSKYTNSVVSDL